jgi:hypothetical protein
MFFFMMDLICAARKNEMRNKMGQERFNIWVRVENEVLQAVDFTKLINDL